MNIKKPRIVREFDMDSGIMNKREFIYKYIHFSAPAMCKIAEELSPNEIKMIMNLANSISKNSNMLLNLIGNPAETKKEILSAMGYISKCNTPINTLTKLIKKDVIKKVKYDKSFCGYAYYVNPYILYYGSTAEDTTFEIFQDSEWKEL